ncbi:MAG: hypothetical protein MJH10_11440 [Epibacterium sp.]|nr:hypothetical protein [Epibacterium sp.]NQX74160.1 hypothetical protein [Epibacterium sp.]
MTISIKKPVITTDGKTATVTINKIVTCTCANILRAYKVLSVVIGGGGLVNALKGYLSTVITLDAKSTLKFTNTIARTKLTIECVTNGINGDVFDIPAYALIDGSEAYSKLN